MTLATTYLNNGGHIDALFLDLAKAFDKIPHQHLRMLQIISYYTESIAIY